MSYLSGRIWIRHNPELAMYGDSGTVALLLLRADTIKNGLLPSFERLFRMNDP